MQFVLQSFFFKVETGLLTGPERSVFFVAHLLRSMPCGPVSVPPLICSPGSGSRACFTSLPLYLCASSDHRCPGRLAVCAVTVVVHQVLLECPPFVSIISYLTFEAPSSVGVSGVSWSLKPAPILPTGKRLTWQKINRSNLVAFFQLACFSFLCREGRARQEVGAGAEGVRAPEVERGEPLPSAIGARVGARGSEKCWTARQATKTTWTTNIKVRRACTCRRLVRRRLFGGGWVGLSETCRDALGDLVEKLVGNLVGDLVGGWSWSEAFAVGGKAVCPQSAGSFGLFPCVVALGHQDSDRSMLALSLAGASFAVQVERMATGSSWRFTRRSTMRLS